MIIRNEYKQLKKENDLIFSTLAECDRDTITGIVNTISNTCGINYEIELVRKDLIAMAASAEADGQYLPAVIGDVDAFKRNLLASMPQPKLIDYMLDSLVWLCLFGLAYRRQRRALWRGAGGGAGGVACAVQPAVSLGLPCPAEHRCAQCNSNRPVCGDYPGAARLAHPPVQSVGRRPTLARCG